MVKLKSYKLVKKAQVWSLDFLVALVIFLFAIFVLYRYTLASSGLEKGEINNLVRDAKYISSSLISEGYPTDWTPLTVTQIGICNSSHKLILNKLQNFKTLVDTDYYKTKTLFNTRYDYLVFFLDKTGNLASFNGVEYQIGKTGVTKDNINTVNKDKLIKLERLILYNQEVYRMVVYVWK